MPMKSVGLGGLGLVLATMAGTAKQRAETHRFQHGRENSAVVWTLHFILLAGAEACVKISEDRGDDE